MTKKNITAASKKVRVARLLGLIGVGLLVASLVLIPLRRPGAAFASTPGDWTTYMNGNARTGYNGAETIINPGTAHNLKLHWQFHAGGAINTQPAVISGTIYWGSWDGYEHAMDLNGNQLWQTYLGKIVQTNSCTPKTAGVASSATVATVSINGTMTPVVFLGGGDAHFYALDATSGAILWSTQLGTLPTYWIWDAPAVYSGSVYIGVSSYGDCPLVKGKLVQMNASTGQIQNTFITVSSCPGGSVWGSPAIDEVNQTIYIVTGNGNCGFGFSFVELHVLDLSLVSSWQVPAPERAGDSDFGSTPTLFQAMINGTTHQLVGALNKFGYYFALDRGNIGAGPVWQAHFPAVGVGGDIASSSWDGTRLYIGTKGITINGVTCNGSIQALDPATGNTLWQYCAPGKVLGALTTVPGLVIAGAGNDIVVLDASTGTRLFKFTDAAKGALFWGAASISNGVLYIGDKAGNFYALGL